ncbi:ABC transporter permease [Secundilactobacillus folii]|uniref:Putative hemin transport system permease protein HrtB n=1 Tax=Secundilactobacillus folii TaxID=2678357 RepID=A0A7X3C2S3_9LACO|nr:FtsX-like permease family protein [Secundilactobacillus folii]MTV81767.1 FtsX-like permease family protein [Secundilactobacillus folii]
MFLAVKEMQHEKFRYGLIIAMIVLIGYLIYVLTSLAIGLARQNTLAIDSWEPKTVLMNRDANISLDQSILQKDDVGHLNKSQALIGQMAVIAKESNRQNESARFIGLSKSQFIYQELKTTSGHLPTKTNQIVVDDKFKDDGYRLKDRVVLNSDNTKFQIVGFLHDQRLNVAPVIYGSLSTWKALKGYRGNQIIGSAVMNKAGSPTYKHKAVKKYTKSQLVNKLPGYSAQNMTFGFMIGFLMAISLVVIAVFLYILTMQKLPNYAVLRAQGIPSSMLVKATVYQSLLIVVIGLVISGVITWGTGKLLPLGVPIYFDIPVLLAVSAGLIIISVLAALIPVRRIITIDPVTVIGG